MNLAKLHEKLKKEGIEIDGISSTGRIDFKEGVKLKDKTRAQKIIDDFKDVPDEKTPLELLLETKTRDEILEKIVMHIGINNLFNNEKN